MHCRSCGADLPADAAYCSQCGDRVELGSVLGVGTDLPPAPARAEPRAAEDLSETRELPRLDPMTTAPAPAPVPAPARTAAAAPAPAPVERSDVASPAAASPAATAPGQPADEPEHSRSSILAMVATFAVLTIIGTFALTRLVGSDDPEPAAQSTPTTAVEESGDAAPAPSTSAPSRSGTSSPQVSPSASTSIPAQARRCSTSGSDAVATAYAGTDRTSCEFAASVRDAYRKAGTPSGATSLRAYSPVTKKWYSLSCDGGEPVRCTSTTNAIVLLTP